MTFAYEARNRIFIGDNVRLETFRDDFNLYPLKLQLK